MRTKISFTIVFSAVIILLCAGRIWANDIIDIVPSSGIGSISLSSNISAINGSPVFRKALANGSAAIAKYASGMIVQYRLADGAVMFVGVEKSSFNGSVYTTKDGIKVGISKSDVERIMGEPSSIVPVTSKDIYPVSSLLAIYAEKGISVQYGDDGKVTVVLVFSPDLFKR